MEREKIYEQETGEPARLNKFPGTNNGLHRPEFVDWLKQKLPSPNGEREEIKVPMAQVVKWQKQNERST